MFLSKVFILINLDTFEQKSAGFIRVWGCGILSENEGSGSTNSRLDFSDFGVLVIC